MVSIKHFVEVPSSDCLIVTAHEGGHKLKLYLLVNHSGPIYKRNGLNSTWDKLNEEENTNIRELVKDALNDTNIPRYSTHSLGILN